MQYMGRLPFTRMTTDHSLFVLAGMQYYCTHCKQKLKPLLHRGGIIVKNIQRDCGYSKRAGLPHLYVGLYDNIHATSSISLV